MNANPAILQPERTSSSPANLSYTLCLHCDHFVEPNPDYRKKLANAEFLHLEDGEQGFDHDPEPGEQTHTLKEWAQLRPDLFWTHLDAIGPNSITHSQRGKL